MLPWGTIARQAGVVALAASVRRHCGSFAAVRWSQNRSAGNCPVEGTPDSELGELTDLHVITLASANPVDMVSSDRHNVKPWFAGKIPFSFDLPELQGSQFELVGGKVSYLEQSPGAQLLFRVRKHQISVFIYQARALPLDFASAEEINARSFHLESWRRTAVFRDRRRGARRPPRPGRTSEQIVPGRRGRSDLTYSEPNHTLR